MVSTGGDKTNAEIIPVGDELLSGDITDTNTPFIAHQLSLLGIDVHYISTVGDEREKLMGILSRAWQRSDLIITIGGLGPTQHDMTREAISQLVGESGTVDDGLKKTLIAYFTRRGLEMPESNIRQVVIIPSATALANPRGTAPGWWVEKEGRTIIALPGPPPEMQAMWQNEVAPRLEKRSRTVIMRRTLKTLGLGEASVEELIAPYLHGVGTTVVTYAKSDGIHLLLTARAAEKETASRLVSELETSLRKVLGDCIWGTDNDTLEEIFSQLITGKGLTLAAAESLTGGFLTFTLSGMPDSGRYFKGGTVVNSDDARAAFGIKAGLVPGKDSQEIAAALASSARSRFTADIGIGIDGYTESTGDTVISRVFIAIDPGKKGKETVESYTARPHMIAKRAAQHALFDLRKFLLSF